MKKSLKDIALNAAINTLDKTSKAIDSVQAKSNNKPKNNIGTSGDSVKVSTLKCPCCGANIDDPQYGSDSYCKYCGSKLFVSEPNESKNHYSTKPKAPKESELFKLLSRRQEIKAAEREKKRRDDNRRFWIGMGILISMGVMLFIIGSSANKKDPSFEERESSTPPSSYSYVHTPFSSNDADKYSCSEAKNLLTEAGFTDISM